MSAPNNSLKINHTVLDMKLPLSLFPSSVISVLSSVHCSAGQHVPNLLFWLIHLQQVLLVETMINITPTFFRYQEKKKIKRNGVSERKNKIKMFLPSVFVKAVCACVYRTNQPLSPHYQREKFPDFAVCFVWRTR